MKKSPKLVAKSKTVTELTKGWKSALPTNIGNLFSYEDKNGIQRIDKYELAAKAIPFLIKLNKGQEIKNITILMGMGEYATQKSKKRSGPDNQLFLPILEVSLKAPINQVSPTYSFILTPILKSSPPPMFSQIKETEDISPKVAELLMLHWQSLTDNALMNAFEGLAGDQVSVDKQSGLESAEITFGRQKLRRVNKYVYSAKETQAILKNIKDLANPSLSLYLGSGLEVPDFHPFSFRPIINVVGQTKLKKNAVGGGDSSNYYDTSRPCPPACPPDN